MPKPVIAFLVNGGPESAMGIRAQSFAQRLDRSYEVHLYYRSTSRVASIFRFLDNLRRLRPQACYIFDLAYSGVVAGLLHRLAFGTPVVTDTGDAVFELARATGRNPLGLLLTAALERAAMRWSDRIVVRSHYHAEWLAFRRIRATVIPDGVDLRQFQTADTASLRRQYGLEECTTVGTLGSLTYNDRTGQCYGMEIIDVVARLKDRNVNGIIIGDGSGLSLLRRRAAERGVDDRILFLGRRPYHELPMLLCLIDICVSTQTNDMPGRVRTTGKLPLYLAADRFVLATNVGEASRVLPKRMLVEYNGTLDSEYPERLARAVAETIDAGLPAAHTRDIASQHFDYDVLTATVDQVLSDLTGTRVDEPAHIPAA
jgi:glycosyltransferase involved in cell wall biosynthesis